MNLIYKVFFRYFGAAFLVTAPLFLTSLTTFSTKLNVVNFDGSSTMQPFINKIFQPIDLNKTININGINHNVNIQSSGTSTGINKLLEGKSSFALSSQNTDKWSDQYKYSKKWKNKKIKTLTIAQDAIVLLYKAPEGCDAEIELDKEKFKIIYSLFTGHKYKNIENKFSYLATSSSGINCDSSITSYARTGGADKSGTAFSFLYANPMFNTIENESSSTADQDWINKVKSSKVGNDFDENKKTNLQFTPESNTLAYELFVKGLKKNKASMIYLSGSFVMENWRDIQNRGFKLAKYKKNGSSYDLSPTSFKENMVGGKYDWIRNLNIIYAIEGITEDQKNIVKYIISRVSQLEQMYVLPIIFNKRSNVCNSSTKNYPESKLFTYDLSCHFNGWTSASCPVCINE